MLELRGISVAYGSIGALSGVSLRVAAGEAVSLLGANGAGKSTVIKAVAGLVGKRAGSIHFDGADITRLASAEIARRGLILVPEGRRLFAPLPVIDNLRLGAYRRLARGRLTPEVRRDLDWVLELFPRLRERKDQIAATLSGGEQQMLAIARGLMARPRLLMVDEPSTGLAPLMVAEIFAVLGRMHRDGLTILLVEQNARLALAASDRAYALETGRVVLEGNSADLRADARIAAAYLAL